MQRATPGQIADTARPYASKADAETGADNAKVMTALRVKQALDSQATGKAMAAAVGIPGDASTMGTAPSTIFTDNGTAKEWFGEAGAAVVRLQQAVTWVTPQMFGYAGDFVADSATPIIAALAFLASVGGGKLFLPKGTYIVSTEIKIPSNVTVEGAGMLLTIIKGADTMPLADNVLTNSLNNRLSRTTYNDNIHITDLTVDGNWQVRAPTSEGNTFNQASCIKYSTVRNCSVKRVRAINGILHCIDIMASVYLNDGSTTAQPDGISYHCLIEDCIAENSSRDDGITTHNSGYIDIRRCQSYFDNALYTVGTNQNGVEVDDGSFKVTVEGCYAYGWAKGFQVKGHENARPAIDVLVSNCVAESCGYSFEAQHGAIGAGVARNVTFRDCISRNATTRAGYLAAMHLSDYTDVLVENFTIEGTSTVIAIRVSGPVPNLRINGVTFKDGTTLTGSTEGLIHIFAGVGALTVSVENVVCETPVGCPVVRYSSVSTIKRVKNIQATGTDAAVGCVWANINASDEISGILQTGFGGDIWSQGNSFLIGGNVSVSKGQRFDLSGTAAPEGSVNAPLGSIYRTTSGTAKLYIKATAPTANTGWVAVGTQT
ncbi:hypothetical protein L286_11215 [Sphingobium sp. HDIP04]|nr:hypothetical protein L286_11215 [Sphingobium sp. HDIP04]